MALPKRDPEISRLIREAVEQVKSRNPHLGEPLKPYTDEEYAETLRDAEEIERVSNSVYEALNGRPISPLIDEDRGE